MPGTILHQRGNGLAELVFALRDGQSRLAHLYQSDPCRILFPRGAAGDPPGAVLLTTSGGLAGGDRVRFALSVEAGAAAVVTSQAAEKVYRSLGPESRVAIDLTVADDAWCEWLPQETILFEGARLRRHTDVTVAGAGRLLACEMLVLGRIARGERFSTGLLHDQWRVRRGEDLAWADSLRLDGDVAAIVGEPAGFAGATALATALYVGPDAGALLAPARQLLAAAASHAGVTLVNGMLLARLVGLQAATVRRDLIAYLAGFRHLAMGLPARMPQVWYS